MAAVSARNLNPPNGYNRSAELKLLPI